jgi:hypothetical protein
MTTKTSNRPAMPPRATTQAGEWGHNPGSDASDTSLATAEGVAVVEPPAAADTPAPERSDEMIHQLLDFDLKPRGDDDDSDPVAFPASRRLIFSASSDGMVSVHRRHSTGMSFTAEEARALYEFLADTARVWIGRQA